MLFLESLMAPKINTHIRHTPYTIHHTYTRKPHFNRAQTYTHTYRREACHGDAVTHTHPPAHLAQDLAQNMIMTTSLGSKRTPRSSLVLAKKPWVSMRSGKAFWLIFPPSQNGFILAFQPPPREVCFIHPAIYGIPSPANPHNENRIFTKAHKASCP
jgi:hypothetical protein